MFKNPLFLKIILVFTLPALGILYFSSVLVYDKIKFLDEIYKTNYNLEYMKVSERLIHSLQTERGLSTIYGKSKEFDEKLKEQRNNTSKNFEKYLNYVDIYTSKVALNQNLEYTIKLIQKEFYNLNTIRLRIESFDISPLEVISEYTKINDFLLDSILSIRSVKSALDFNNEFSNIYHFLIFKEYIGIERALISYSLMKGSLDKKMSEELLITQTVQSENFHYFNKNTTIKFFSSYNDYLPIELSNEIDNIRKNLEKNIETKNVDLMQWWDLSTRKINYLDDIFNKIIIDLEKISEEIQKKAFIEQNLSLVFLLITFMTLISLLFVLKNIVFRQQKSFEKIEKQKRVYELLSNTNKYLLNNNTKKELYSHLHDIISKHSSMVFSFIYDIEGKTFNDIKNAEIYAQNGTLKDLLFSRLEEFKESNSDNLLTEAINLESNIIVESFEDTNISVFFKYAKKFNIKSAAAFPIKKFDKMVSIFVIYSNENKFFDYEIEILFNKLVNDLSHTLEKFDYEEIRLKQEKELKIASFAFESSEPMLITDEEVRIINVNSAFCEVMGVEKEDLIGKNPRTFKSLHQKRDFYDNLWKELIQNNSWRGELYNTKFNGELIPLRVTITAIKDKNNNVTNYIAQYTDISEQKDRQQVLEYQATHDNLTGLPNRLLLLDRIEHAITKVVRHKIVGGIIFIDLDNFKEVNDTLGHDIGDALLVTVAKKLKEVVRDEDTVSRIGGDEFIILADNIGTTNNEARINIDVLAKKIQEVLNDIKYINGYKNISTPSIGITLFNDASVSVKDIIKQADTAMYVAKKQGKNAIEFF
ncbi:diguanylate cyclase [bacterium]|jgi:diguanylate cyclase (GGDEF)-like protein/PAS domain S-box-containing protein|nr:diguanylate cyclase [bacterium]